MIYIWFLVAFVGNLFNNLVYAPLARKNWALETAFLRYISIAIIMFPILFFANFSKLTLEVFFYMVCIWILVASWVFANFKAFEYLPVWVIKSIASLYNVVVLILWYLVYNETLSLFWYIWAVIILLSWIGLAIKGEKIAHLKWNHKKWFVLALYRALTQAI